MADIAARRAKLSGLAAERNVLEMQEQALLRELALVRDSIRRNAIEAAEHSPVYTLPDDILMDILELAYEHVPQDRRCALERNPSIPTMVCRRWRRAALALPRLWCCLHIGNSPELLALWLARSKSLPLHIICRGKDADARQSGHAMTAAQATAWTGVYLRGIESLLLHASRWQHFDIETSHSVFLQTVLNVIRLKVYPSLRYLAVWHAGHSSNLPLTVELPECPALAELALLRMPPSFSKFTPMRHLKELYLGCCALSISQLQQLSLAAPKLTELTMDEVTDSGSPDGAENSVLFPHLKTLTFLLMDFEDFFAWIDAPLLDTLTCDQAPLWADAPVVNASAPQLPALRTLRLPRCIVQPGYDGELFRRAPNIVDLDLGGCADAFGAVLGALVWSHDRLLPRLETITLTEPDADHHDVLLRLLERRHREERPLKEIRFGRDLYQMRLWKDHQLERLVKVTCIADEDDTREVEPETDGPSNGVAYW